MVAASARPLSDALRLSFVELVQWLVADHGFDKADALQLVSQAATIRVGNMVDPLYTVVAKFPKRLLKPAGGTAGVRLRDIPWTEAEPVLTRERVVVLPLGAASKEHGPHLPLGNDEILAEYLADRVVRARPVAVLPTLTYGYYKSFLEYPGSVSLSEATQRDAVVEIARSIAGYGPRRFYVLNTGISTTGPLRAAAEILGREGILMRFTDIEKVGHAAEQAVKEEKVGTHADEIETSMVLYMRPGAVRMERAVADGLVYRDAALTRDTHSRIGHVSPSGVYGDPSRASWAKGERVTEAKVADILAEIDALALAPVPAGQPRSPLEEGAVR